MGSHGLDGLGSHRLDGLGSHRLEWLGSHRLDGLGSHRLDGLGSHRLSGLGSHGLKWLGSHRYKELGSLREVVIDGHGGRFALYGERRRGGVDVAEGLHGDARVRSVRNLKTAAMQLGLVDGEGK